MALHYAVRTLTAEDTTFLEEMLLEAVNWNESRPVHSLDEMRRVPALWHYAEGWPRSDDFGVLASDSDGAPVGAAWGRYFSEHDRGYGFVRESVPEIGMGVVSTHRGEGIGGELLDALIHVARERRIEGLSLSVEDENERARRLYERRKFVAVGREGASDVMLLTLS